MIAVDVPLVIELQQPVRIGVGYADAVGKGGVYIVFLTVFKQQLAVFLPVGHRDHAVIQTDVVLEYVIKGILNFVGIAVGPDEADIVERPALDAEQFTQTHFPDPVFREHPQKLRFQRQQREFLKLNEFSFRCRSLFNGLPDDIDAVPAAGQHFPVAVIYFQKTAVLLSETALPDQFLHLLTFISDYQAAQQLQCPGEVYGIGKGSITEGGDLFHATADHVPALALAYGRIADHALSH